MPFKVALGTCGEYTLGCEVGCSRGARNPAGGVEVAESRDAGCLNQDAWGGGNKKLSFWFSSAAQHNLVTQDSNSDAFCPTRLALTGLSAWRFSLRVSHAVTGRWYPG